LIVSRKWNRPKRLFRVRTAGPAVLIGPAFDHGRRPHYEECVDELLRRHDAEIRAGLARGVRYDFEIRHDSWCPALTEGGCCNCDCVVNLIVAHDPVEEN
jgi:hypothetical protein